jgi:dTDP-glucose 4,6-dehydratase
MKLITGGAGFIGGNYLHYLYKKDPTDRVICVDSLTYASNYSYIKPLIDCGFVVFEQCNIADEYAISEVFKKYNPDQIVNFAAESHVDNSIFDFQPFVTTNILGTINLLQCARKNLKLKKFVHISTDEVFGSLELNDTNSFKETTAYKPNSPYSASKASSDHFVNVFRTTYELPTVITNCSNNYGPSQNKEKLIPKIIHNAINDINIPLYGDGLNIRDWLYVEDHCLGIDLVLQNGKIGESYNIGGGVELSNIDLIKMILKLLNKPESLIEYVDDRLGHDRKYSINCDKIQNELGYFPRYTLEQGITMTLEWNKNGI